MTTCHRWLLSLLSASIALALDPAQVPATPPDPGAGAKATTRRVVLDVVVRDKRGRLIPDLKPTSLAVNDSGVKQNISGFRLIQGIEAIGADGLKTPLDALHQVRLVTLVFETMADADLRSPDRNTSPGLQSPSQSGRGAGGGAGAESDRRRIAQRAALEVLKDPPAANVYYSVLAMNTQLLVLQPFTQDTTALGKAVERATSGSAATELTPDSNRIKTELQQFVAQHPRQEAGWNAPASIQAVLAETMLDMLKSTTANAGGPRLTIESLQSICRGLSGMPSRKEILYFTTGLRLPTFLDVAFLNLKGLANRANVAIYALDTRGVAGQTETGISDLNNAISSAASSDMRVAMHASDGVESAFRANVQLPIRELSDDTGGFLIADSNNLAGPLRRAIEEVNNYYEISYDPGITEYDGGFRKFNVDLSRKDGVVHSRSGYLAMPADLRATSAQSFEAPLLTALAGGQLSKELDFLASAVQLQPKATGTDLSVLVEIPLHVLRAKPEGGQGAASVSFALAAVVKSASGETVQKLTREHSLQVSPEQMKAGNFIEKFAATVPAGTYKLESAVMDRVSGKIGIERSEFTVSPKAKGVNISSLTPVRSYAPNAKGLDASEAFQFQGGAITPMLNNTVTRSEKGVLPLFFTVYPDPALNGKCTVDIEFFQNGKSLQKGTLPMPVQDALGRIPYVFSVPGSIPPGSYEIRATARQGDTSAEAKTVVKVEAP